MVSLDHEVFKSYYKLRLFTPMEGKDACSEHFDKTCFV